MKKLDMKSIATFAALCIALGKKEEDYNVEAATTNANKAAICKKRVQLITNGYNGDKKANMADTSQYKYLAIVQFIPDPTAPAGFRLAFLGFGLDYSDAFLGARPYLLDSNDVEPAFEQWKAEYEQWMQYEALSLMED